MTIQVTEKHIREGKRGECECCPEHSGIPALTSPQTFPATLHRDTLERMGRQRYQKPNVIRTAHGWKIRYRLYFLDGSSEERTKHFACSGKREAEKARDEFLRTINTPEESLPSQAKFGIILDQYIAQAEASVEEVTCANYRSTIGTHIKPRWGETRMCDFSQMEVESWLAQLSLKYRDKTINNVKAVFGLAWKAAIRWGFTRLVNPVSLAPRRIGRPKEPRSKALPTDDQLRATLALLATGPRLMIQIMTFTGLRSCETLALTWRDVSGDRVTINKSVQQKSNLVQARVKTEKARRVIPISHLRHLLVRPEGADPDSRIYPDSYCALLWALKKAAGVAGCDYEGFGCHTFRRWFNTSFRMAGGSIELAMEQMGHASKEVNRIYMLDSQVDARAEVAARITERITVQ